MAAGLRAAGLRVRGSGGVHHTRPIFTVRHRGVYRVPCVGAGAAAPADTGRAGRPCRAGSAAGGGAHDGKAHVSAARANGLHISIPASFRM